MLHARVVFVRNIIVKDIFDLIDKYEGHSLLEGPLLVLNMIANAPPEDQKLLKNKIYVMTAGMTPPPSSILQKMESLGFEVMHVYGLTETYGHVTHCAWNEDWNNLSEEDRFEREIFSGCRISSY